MGEGLDLMNIHDPPGLSGSPAALSPEDESQPTPPPTTGEAWVGETAPAIESQL